MDDTRKEIVNNVLDCLHGDLRISPCFLDMLLQFGVLTEETKEQLQEEKASCARAQLIDVIKKCGNEQYDAFLHVLRQADIGQSHIADKLETAEKVYKDKSLTEKVKNKIQIFVQKHYMNGRHFTPMEENIITKSLVLEEDYMEQLIQNKMYIKNNRKLKQEVMTKTTEIQKMSVSHSREISALNRKLREAESELNQYKTTLDAQVRKCDQLQEQLVKLEHNGVKDGGVKDGQGRPSKNSRKTPRDNDNNSRHLSQDASRSGDSGNGSYYSDNRAIENRNELTRTKNELKQLQRRFDLHQKALDRLNAELSQYANAGDTGVKETGDPLKALERRIRNLNRSLNSDTNIKATYRRAMEHSVDSGTGSNPSNSSMDKIQDKLRKEHKEKAGLKRALREVKDKLREAQLVIAEMSGSSESSGSRRASLAPGEGREGRGEGREGGLEQTDGSLRSGGSGEARLPVLTTRAKHSNRLRPEPSYTHARPETTYTHARPEASYTHASGGRMMSAPVTARSSPSPLCMPLSPAPVATPTPVLRTTPTPPVLRPTEFKMEFPTELPGSARAKPVYANQRPFLLKDSKY